MTTAEDTALGAGCQATIFLAHHSCPELLGNAIDSVLAQTATGWQLAVVDDHSLTPQAFGALRSRWNDSRLLWLQTSANVGQFRIYNRLLPAVASPFIMLQDADDVSSPIRLETLLSRVKAGGWDLLGSAVARISRTGAVLEHVQPPPDVNRSMRWRRRGGAVIGPTLLVRTDFLRSLGGYDGGTRIGADTELAFRAVFAGRVGNLEQVLYRQTVREESLTNDPQTGFTSTVRRAYGRAIGRRFQVNLLRHWSGRLQPEHLRARSNDIHFELRRPDGSRWPH